MPYILDGNNLIGNASPTEEERGALVAELAARLRRTRATAMLVFDGSRRAQTILGSLTVRDGFAASADDDIVRQVEESRDPRGVTVVTSDRALSTRVRNAGAKTLPPEKFWSRFGKSPHPAGEREDPVDVEEWMSYFEDEQNREKN